MIANRTKPKVPRLYGVTERKKEELDALTLQVLDAQQQVDQYQAIVTSLTAKLANYTAMLATADNNRTNALNNRNTVDQVVQNFSDLLNNSVNGFTAIAMADQQTKQLTTHMSKLINKLIYSAEVINKLGTYVTRKKASNPLVSDELVSMLTTAGNDANNAVALTLVALQSVFAAQASNIESESAFALEYVQAQTLYYTITGTLPVAPLSLSKNANAPQKKITDLVKLHVKKTSEEEEHKSLQGLLHDAYTKAVVDYRKMQKATDLTTKELNNAQINLNEAQVNLQSLQLGLAAGNAAALAS
jgi:hypothetical protein